MKRNHLIKFRRPWMFVAAISIAGMGLAQAHGDNRGGNIYWSIGMSSPGVQVGVASGPPVVYMPQPIYTYPSPVVYMPPAPVYYGTPPGWRGRHGYKHHDFDDGRYRYGGNKAYRGRHGEGRGRHD